MQFFLGQIERVYRIYFNTYTVNGFRDNMNTCEQGSVPYFTRRVRQNGCVCIRSKIVPLDGL